jgi:hypothetical protein
MLSHRPAQLSYRQAAEWLVEVRFAEPFDPEPLLTYIEQNPNWLQAYSPNSAKNSRLFSTTSSASRWFEYGPRSKS